MHPSPGPFELQARGQWSVNISSLPELEYLLPYAVAVPDQNGDGWEDLIALGRGVARHRDSSEDYFSKLLVVSGGSGELLWQRDIEVAGPSAVLYIWVAKSRSGEPRVVFVSAASERDDRGETRVVSQYAISRLDLIESQVIDFDSAVVRELTLDHTYSRGYAPYDGYMWESSPPASLLAELDLEGGWEMQKLTFRYDYVGEVPDLDGDGRPESIRELNLYLSREPDGGGVLIPHGSNDGERAYFPGTMIVLLRGPGGFTAAVVAPMWAGLWEAGRIWANKWEWMPRFDAKEPR